jgi:hypothetical protein
MTSDSASPSRTNPTWVVLLTALALLAGLAMWRTADRAMKMKSATSAGPDQFAALKPGETTKVVLEVTYSTSPTNLQGKLLEKKTETVYRRTAELVEVAFDAKTPVVMGKTADLRPGAVIHVSGTVNASHVLEATQIVILTGYVQVDSAQP